MLAGRTLRAMGTELEDRLAVDGTSVTPARSRWATLGFGSALALIAALVAAYALSGRDRADPEPAAPPATTAISGSLELTLPHFTWSNSTNTCWGDGGFSDIREGAQVVVSDAAGAVIAVSALSAGLPSVAGGRATSCTFGITVTNVPSGRTFYGVEVSHRGVVRFAEVDLGRVALSLG